MPEPRHLLIVAGDPSADRHGAALIQALRRRAPHLKITALGGSSLKEAADVFAYPLVGVGGFGFWEPLAKLPQLWKVRQIIRQLLKNDRPDLVIPMDYYGFNIHVAKLAHAAKIPVVYYISPQVWASRPGRVQDLAKQITKMLVIFPFEEAIYKKAGVPVRFVGHPLMERVPSPEAPSDPMTVGLLPGSRRSVVERHLPIMAATADHLHREFPDVRFILFRAAELDALIYQPTLARSPWIRLVSDPTYEERKKLSLAISVSGTSALENMLLGIPMVIMYRLSFLTYHIAKHLIRIPYVGIPNILAGRLVVPELLQDQASPITLAQTAAPFLRDATLRQTMRQTLLALRQTLDEGGSQKAADEILTILGAETKQPYETV